MNFQQLRSTKGQKGEDGQDVKLTMYAVFGEGVGNTSYTRNQKQTCICKITDDNNETHKVHLYGTLPGPERMGQRNQFLLSAYDGDYQGKPYVGYSGFWEHGEVRQGSQDSSQASQNPPGSSNASQEGQTTKKEPDWDAIAEGKVRHGVVCAAIQAGQVTCQTPKDVLDWTQFIITGVEVEAIAPAPQAADDIPF